MAIKIVLAAFSCILCKSVNIISTEDAPKKTFTEAYDEIKVNHITSYKIEQNPDYELVLREMRRIARERLSKSPEALGTARAVGKPLKTSDIGELKILDNSPYSGEPAGEVKKSAI